MAQEEPAVSRRRMNRPDPREALSLGLAILMLRWASGMSCGAVAEASGVTRSNLSVFETGKREPKVDTLRRLVAAMGYTMADLWRAHELARELAGPESREPASGDGTLPPDNRWPPEEARKAALQLAQECGKAVAHVALAFMELQAGGWHR
jgi:transcriptional regulator with XRE-family HTH domain